MDVNFIYIYNISIKIKETHTLGCKDTRNPGIFLNKRALLNHLLNTTHMIELQEK